MMLDQMIVAAARADLAVHINICDTLSLLFTALYNRKKSSFLSLNMNNIGNDNREAMTEQNTALKILNRLLTETKILSGVLKSILIIFDYKELQFACILDHSPLNLSLTQLYQSRIEKHENMIFLPNILNYSSLLRDELIIRLPEQIQPITNIIQGNNIQGNNIQGNIQGIYPSGGEPLDSSFYTAIAKFLWLPLLSVRTLDPEKPDSLEKNQKKEQQQQQEQEQEGDVYYTTALAGQSVVLFVLLDALLLSTPNCSIKKCENFCKILSEAYNLHHTDVIRIFSLWCVDARMDIQRAIENFCDPSISLFEDTTLLFRGE